MSTQNFGVFWKKTLVSLPRLVPDFVLHFTSPDGPQPIVFDIPSRGSHKIPVYVFIPPHRNPHHHQLASEGTHLKEALQPNPEDDDVKLPVLIDFHGGGFVLGSCQEQAPFCGKMCRTLNCVVISVDYRLGPAAQFPAAHHDAEDAVHAVLDPSKPAYEALRAGISRYLKKEGRKPIMLDEEKIAISGFSSGGNLALNMALSVKNDPMTKADWLSAVPWDFKNRVPVLLFYPALDTRLLPHERPKPTGWNVPKGFVERWKIEAELMPTYLPVSMSGFPRASPGLADIKAKDDESKSGLHPKAKIFLVLPSIDTLNHQSKVWVKKVRDEGRGEDLVVEEIKDVVHGWTQFPDSWLDDESRRLKWEVFEKAGQFVWNQWNVQGNEVDVEVTGADKEADVPSIEKS
ncbi:hypothetical protein LTR10_023318 [Elasticomyces elasticus]|uniref:Alpha/beta hydrolase fold-3 domain-containing protein n=1 Tax=Exophiala sideris TaxID=1016849 RepID=A0ABR0JS02_9EURO|nr:hypothetical protein LTR10_023318 [Elasticomyces elasticus]KAK5040374.1 hypothetical protein LTS07_000872 [Exophiala sideris]KAK5043199.1 hypothetical protein LTR13_000970 [Exophiala sideris]KAK5068752.1 hypothetical protein LTR69_000873 [Exophiala sideris]KAK5186350.1 hypothetical protein LTR44_001406 [Eurotiomycetes sp. CCFEE 6388]